MIGHISLHFGTNTPNRRVTIIVIGARIGSAFAFMVLSRVAQAEDFVWKYSAIGMVA